MRFRFRSCLLGTLPVLLLLACGPKTEGEGTDVEPSPSGGRTERPGEYDQTGRMTKTVGDSIRLEDTLSAPKPGTYVPDTGRDTSTVTKTAGDSVRLEDTLSAPAPGTYVPDSAPDTSRS
ncbi:MAG TPA: hypothetical protein VFO95_14245 [Gemmatimonadales bacterium]|nr:hypothetical protein [Gemmatimonadales bacterium]